MNARGILFKPDLYDAIVAGHKTETRRQSRDWLRLKAGDRLWVREKLMRQDADGHASWAEYARDGKPAGFEWRWSRDWLSPLHMPREAARLHLELVEDPRWERVEDIDGDGARREGVRPDGDGWRFGDVWRVSARDAFLARWEEIHGIGGECAVLRFKLLGGAP